MDDATLAAISTALAPLELGRDARQVVECRLGRISAAGEWGLLRRRLQSQLLSLPPLQRDAAREALRRAREAVDWLNDWTYVSQDGAAQSGVSVSPSCERLQAASNCPRKRRLIDPRR